jgi:lysophospholipase L1-like esterase
MSLLAACAAACLVLVPLAAWAAAPDEAPLVRPDDPRIAVMGRMDRRNPARPRLGYPGITFRLRFDGPTLAIRAADSGQSSFDVVVDGAPPIAVRLGHDEERDYVLAAGLDAGIHLAEVVRRNETWQGVVTVAGFRVAPGHAVLDAPPLPRRRLLFVGDSVTAGEGAGRAGECAKDAPRLASAWASYGMVLARTLDAQVQIVAFGGRGLTRDWQGRTDVLTAPQFFELDIPEADGPPPPPTDHAAFVPDAVVVSLGTNDFNLALGPLPAREPFVAAYVAFVRRLRGVFPRAHLFLTEGAIVDDADAERRPRTTLASYIDETVERLGDRAVHHPPAGHYAGDACDAHPTGPQHLRMAAELEPPVRAALGW